MPGRRLRQAHRFGLQERSSMRQWRQVGLQPSAPVLLFLSSRQNRTVSTAAGAFSGGRNGPGVSFQGKDGNQQRIHRTTAATGALGRRRRQQTFRQSSGLRCRRAQQNQQQNVVGCRQLHRFNLPANHHELRQGRPHHQQLQGRL